MQKATARTALIFMFKIFRYCPSCGKQLEKSKIPKLIDCGNCGFHYYINIYPTVAAILENKRGQILLVERKNPPKKGYWDLPGGFLEFNENLENALIRELKEELGVNLRGLSYIGSATDLYPYKGITYNIVVAVYKGTIGDKIYPADDVASFKFVDKKNYNKNEFAFPGLSKIIEGYIRNDPGS